jgi:hypothetical protein
MGSLAQRTTVIVPLAWQHSPSLVVRRLSCQPGWRVRFGGAIGGRIAGLMGYKGLLHDYNLTKRRYSTLPKLHTQYKTAFRISLALHALRHTCCRNTGQLTKCRRSHSTSCSRAISGQCALRVTIQHTQKIGYYASSVHTRPISVHAT